MAATDNFNAGLDSSNVTLGYIEESNWGTTPASNLTLVRMRSEGFAGSKSRARPDEIRAAGDAAQAITQSVEASGSISGLLSHATYNEFIAGMVNGEWVARLSLTSSSSRTVAVANTAKTFTLGGSGAEFATFLPGTYFKASGFATANAANNGYFKVISKTSNQIIVVEKLTNAGGAKTLSNVTINNATVTLERLAYVRNAAAFTSFSIEKKLADDKYLTYPGSYITGGGIATNQGSFAECNFDFLCKEEKKATATINGGTLVQAPTGRVIDTVTGLKNFNMSGVTTQPILQSISWSIAKEGARQQFGIGNVGALGMGRGTVTLSGSLTTYFKDFSIYDSFVNETSSELVYRVEDSSGKGYIITLPNVTITNPSITAGGPDTDMIADFELEGNSATSGAYNGVTIQIAVDN